MSIKNLKNLINGDDFFRARLPWMANDVRHGDNFFMRQNYATSGDKDRAWSIVNSYNSLLDRGHTNAEIMGAIYGNPESYADWDINPPTKTSNGQPIKASGNGGGNGGGGMLSQLSNMQGQASQVKKGGMLNGLGDMREKIFQSLGKMGKQ